MLKKVKEAIACFDLLQNAKHITVALSGGADSMALMCALLELKNELGIEKISAAHFNHQIRGQEALRDQNFVAEFCKKSDVELFFGSADVPAVAKTKGISIELAARKLRYEFFEGIDTDLIATAHTASDNVETVLFNLARGTALSGLCGIPPKREKFIRPLIFCTRDDIENYCAQKGIAFVTDSTNQCDDYTRNKLRHNAVPVLKEVNSSLENAVGRMACTLRDDEDYLDNVAQDLFEKSLKDDALNISGFKSIHKAIMKRIIAKYCEYSAVEVDNLHINQMCEIVLNGGKISLSGNNVAIAKNDILTIISANFKQRRVRFEVKIEQTDNNIFENNKKVHNLLLKNILDYDKIVGRLVLRTRAQGDTIRLKNKNCTKTLKKLFCEYKIPLDERDSLPVISDDEGVVWVHKIGVAERCAADQSSTQIYKILVEKF